MAARPLTRLKKLIIKRDQGLATEEELEKIEELQDKLRERLASRREWRYMLRKQGEDADPIDQVGGGLVAPAPKVKSDKDSAEEDALAELTPHEEVWDRIWVTPKEGGALVPFEMKFWQEQLVERVRVNRRQRKPTRLIIVKGRQFGTTTGTAALMYSELATQPGVPAIAVTYKKADHRVLPIATTYRTFIESDPWFADEPPQYYSVSNWQGANGSSIQFHIAGEAIGRGPHYRMLHGTEVDFWLDFDATMKGLMQAVADHWTAIVILETTLGDRPNPGLRKLIKDVTCDPPKNDQWEVWFQAWWQYPEYRAGHPSNPYPWTPEIEHRVITSLTHKEKLLLELGAPPAAIEWRRKTIMVKCNNDEATFAQEYPATLDEALEFRGSWYYQRSALQYHLKNVCEPKFRYRLVLDGIQWGVVPSLNDGQPHLRVWEPPDPTKTYRLGADVAASEDLSAARSDITIIDRVSGRVVARWWGQVPAHRFGQMIHCAAGYYGDAEIMFDRTGVGAAVVGELERLNTPNVYLGTQNKPGFHFSEEVRQSILGTTQKFVDDCWLFIPCEELLKQMDDFTGDTKRDGGWTDAVVSLSLACYRLPESAEWQTWKAPELPIEYEDDGPIQGPLTAEKVALIRERIASRSNGAGERMFQYT